MSLTMGSSAILLFLPLSKISLVKETPGIVQHTFYVMRFILSSGIQAMLTSRLTLKVLSIKMYIHALLHTVLLSCLPDNSMAGWQLASFLYVNAKGSNMSVSYHYGSFFYLADYIYNRNGMASSVVELSWSTLQLTSQQLKLPNESQILKLMVWNLHFLGHMVPLHWAQLG